MAQRARMEKEVEEAKEVEEVKQQASNLIRYNPF